MAKMYVWKVGLELQWKSTWKADGKARFEFWEDENAEFTVAAPTGKEAITKAEKLAMASEKWTGEHYNDDGDTVPSTEQPYKVLDIISLDLLQTLDG